MGNKLLASHNYSFIYNILYCYFYEFTENIKNLSVTNNFESKCKKENHLYI